MQSIRILTVEFGVLHKSRSFLQKSRCVTMLMITNIFDMSVKNLLMENLHLCKVNLHSTVVALLLGYWHCQRKIGGLTEVNETD